MSAARITTGVPLHWAGDAEMPRFFVKSSDIADGIVTIRGDDAHHISRSLRMAAGEHITVCDDRGQQYDCVLSGFCGAVTARIVSESCAGGEMPMRVHLFQALVKGDKLDTVIQKAVECGAADIAPFECRRCIVRVKPEAEAERTRRRARIALEAAKQCGRSVVPEVRDTVSFDDMLQYSVEHGGLLICYEGETTVSLRQALKRLTEQGQHEICLVIGPEGGFDPDEIARAVTGGAVTVGLGPRILRTETAATFALACLTYELEM